MRKLTAVPAVVATALVLWANSAAAQTTFDPGGEATSVFDSNWALVLDLFTTIAPYAIGAALTLLAIRKIVSSLGRARAAKV